MTPRSDFMSTWVFAESVPIVQRSSPESVTTLAASFKELPNNSLVPTPEGDGRFVSVCSGAAQLRRWADLVVVAPSW